MSVDVLESWPILTKCYSSEEVEVVTTLGVPIADIDLDQLDD